MIGDCVNVAETVGENINGAFDLNEASITGDGDSDATVTGDAVDSEPLDLGSRTGTFVILNCIGTKDCSAFLGTRDFDRALVLLLGGGHHVRKGLGGNFGQIASNMLYGACLCIAYRCSVSINGLRIPYQLMS